MLFSPPFKAIMQLYITNNPLCNLLKIKLRGMVKFIKILSLAQLNLDTHIKDVQVDATASIKVGRPKIKGFSDRRSSSTLKFSLIQMLLDNHSGHSSISSFIITNWVRAVLNFYKLLFMAALSETLSDTRIMIAFRNRTANPLMEIYSR